MAVLVAGLAAASCLGDVEIVEPSDDPNTDINMLEPPCEDGEVRCNGAWLERCAAAADGSTTRWNKVENCDAPALCSKDQSMCLVSPCGDDRARCEGASPQVCANDLSGWVGLEDSCLSAAHCSLDSAACGTETKEAPCCLSEPCTAGQLRCNGSQLERCRPDTSGYNPELPAACDTPLLCERALGECQSAGSCACVPAICELDELRCTGATLERCSADRTTWEFVETCATPELCRVASDPLDVAVASCPVPCGVGEFQCFGADLMLCNEGRTGFVLQQPCPAGTICSTTGACRDTCDPTERQCNGAQIEQCAASLTAFEPAVGDGTLCDTPELCVDTAPVGQARCDIAACGINAFSCAGTQLTQCNAGRTASLPVGQPCPREDLCSTERGRCDFCVPNRQECTPNLTAARQCAADGNAFGPLTNCPLGCIAATGLCRTCTIGSYTCAANQLSRCDNGFSFTPLGRATDCSANNTQQTTCTGNTLSTPPCGFGCNTTRNVCNQCSGATRQCVGNSDNFQVCQANGTFGASQACPAGLDCSGAGACGCTPGAATCDDDDLVVCNAAGSGFVAGATCAGVVRRTCANGALTSVPCGSAGLCTSGTGAACGGCVNGERSCSGGINSQPVVCASGAFQAAPSCDADFACEDAGVCRCAAGSLRCEADAVTACNAGRTAFAATPRCSGATLRACNAAGTVLQLPCGSAALCAASPGDACVECVEPTPSTCTADGQLETCVAGDLQQAPCPEGTTCFPLLGCLGLAASGG